MYVVYIYHIIVKIILHNVVLNFTPSWKITFI